MSDPESTADEVHRLEALRALRILDTAPEAAFDDLTRVASRICGMPIALVTLVDERRQWFKSEIGLGMSETGLDRSVCVHAIREPDILVVPDLTADPRFRDNPLVTGMPHLRFYAGVPLRTGTGLTLGTLCVLDTRPNSLDEHQLDTLRVLGRQVMNLLDLRRANAALDQAVAERDQADKDNTALLHELQHRFKNSLQTIDSLISLQSRREATPEGRNAITRMRDRLRPLYLIQDRQQPVRMGSVDVRAYLHDIVRCVGDLHRSRGVQADVVEHLVDLEVPREKALPLGLVVSEFVDNSFRHAIPSGGKKVAIELERHDAGKVRLTLADDGPGFASAPQLPNTGLGLQLITALSGQIGAAPVWDNENGAKLILEFAVV
ncbi:sensor histidine kinase [Geminicoccus roseus]|uniref:sensor histidine kinase n=1 Tax=Geminicoccus roseus TaxID=404900 RepID=UPI0003F7A1D6|nr:GAF domain-containing protein [Geminicoccus roseus]